MTTINGFEECDFLPDGDQCQCCDKSFQQLWWRKTDYWSQDGEYYCYECVMGTLESRLDESDHDR